MKVSISNRAQEDLVGIWEFSARAWGNEHADLYIDLLVLRFSWLTENQDLWRERTEISPRLYCYQEKSHVIYFKSAGELIEIIRVLHKHMDPALNLE